MHGGSRPETVETYRRVPGHVLRNLSGAAPTFTGLPIGSKGHSRMPDMPPCRAMHIAGYGRPRMLVSHRWAPSSNPYF